MLSIGWWRRIYIQWRSRHPHRGNYQWHLRAAGMHGMGHDATRFDLRIGECIAHFVDRPCNEVGLLQDGQPFGLGASAEDILEILDQGFAMNDPGAVAAVPRVFGERFSADYAAQLL